MPLTIINNKLKELLNDPSTDIRVEFDYEKYDVPSFKIITGKSTTRYSIQKGKLLSGVESAEIKNIIPEFYKFSKYTLVREWNLGKPKGADAIEALQFDLDIPTTKTLALNHDIEPHTMPSYQIEYRFDHERQVIKLEFTLRPIQLPTISYRSFAYLLNNLGPVSDKTVHGLIKKLHATIISDAVFFAVTANAKLDLVLFRKFIKENKPVITRTDNLDLNEVLPVYERPYTTQRNVRVK